MAAIIKLIAFVGETVVSMVIQASANRLFKFIVSKIHPPKVDSKTEPMKNSDSEFDLSAFPNRADEMENDFRFKRFPNSDKPKPKRESRTRYGLPKARETG